MEKMTFAPPLHGTSDVALDLIEKIGTVTPGNLNYCKRSAAARKRPRPP